MNATVAVLFDCALLQIAVLQIDAPPASLTPIELGSSGILKVGQLALAIGNPFGLDHTLTTVRCSLTMAIVMLSTVHIALQRVFLSSEHVPTVPAADVV
jgi:hypothetical protein